MELDLPVKIFRTCLADMIAHALRDDPNECCGFLLGVDGEASHVWQAKNIHSDKISRYNIDPGDVVKAQRKADELGGDIVGIYHSHPYTQAHPSDTDVRNAVESGWTDPFYVLISLVEKTRPVVRAFRISKNRSVQEVVIATDGRTYHGASG